MKDNGQTIINIQSGQALLLIILLIAVIFKQLWLLPWAIGFLAVLMAAPQVMAPFAKIWFGFSEKLGYIMSKIILSVIFYVVVCPVAIFRKILGADAMQLKKWKKGQESVFSVNERTLTPSDLEKPY